MIFPVPEEVKNAINMLSKEGFSVHIVGGALRDIFLGKITKDWDISTSAKPDEIKDIFKGYELLEKGLRHGTITLVGEKYNIEITTYRVDGIYSDNRRPDTVIFTDSLEEDLKRRDFTINAMAYDLKEVIDYHKGKEDLENRIIRSVGDPMVRFSEDALRILRGLRFASVLDFEIEKETAKAIHLSKEMVNKISADRTRIELTKLLRGKAAPRILDEFSDVISEIIPEIKPMIGLPQKNPQHHLDVWQHTLEVVKNSLNTTISRWAALLHDVGKPDCLEVNEEGLWFFYGHAAVGHERAGEILERLNFDRETRNKILLLIKYHDTRVAVSYGWVRKYLNILGKDTFYMLVDLFKADNMAQAEKYRYRQKTCDVLLEIAKNIEEEKSCLSLADLDIKGGDLKELGYRGENIGRMLQMLLSAVINEEVENEKEKLIDYCTNKATSFISSSKTIL